MADAYEAVYLGPGSGNPGQWVVSEIDRFGSRLHLVGFGIVEHAPAFAIESHARDFAKMLSIARREREKEV